MAQITRHGSERRGVCLTHQAHFTRAATSHTSCIVGLVACAQLHGWFILTQDFRTWCTANTERAEARDANLQRMDVYNI